MYGIVKYILKEIYILYNANFENVSGELLTKHNLKDKNNIPCWILFNSLCKYVYNSKIYFISCKIIEFKIYQGFCWFEYMSCVLKG